jgi:hypothetical protein
MYVYYNISLNSSYNEKYFQVLEKIKTQNLCAMNFFRMSRRLWDNVESQAGQMKI